MCQTSKWSPYYTHMTIFFKKGSIDDDVLYDVLYDDDDGHKDNDHDNHAHYGDNDNLVINVIIPIITYDDDDVDGVFMTLMTMTTMMMVLFMTINK